jgi:hypothetical protein
MLCKSCSKGIQRQLAFCPYCGTKTNARGFIPAFVLMAIVAASVYLGVGLFHLVSQGQSPGKEPLPQVPAGGQRLSANEMSKDVRPRTVMPEGAAHSRSNVQSLPQSSTKVHTTLEPGSAAQPWQSENTGPHPQVISFQVVPSEVEQCGIAILRWTVKDALSIRIEPQIGSFTTMTGYKIVRPVKTATYTLVAEGDAGPALSSTVTLTVLNETKTTCNYSSPEFPRDKQ